VGSDTRWGPGLALRQEHECKRYQEFEFGAFLQSLHNSQKIFGRPLRWRQVSNVIARVVDLYSFVSLVDPLSSLVPKDPNHTLLLAGIFSFIYSTFLRYSQLRNFSDRNPFPLNTDLRDTLDTVL